MDLKEIFEHKIKIESKVKSIDALFMNKERVEHTNYHPYYQRNYVWDEEKATYFIESIFLGTEIPPLIFFVNDEEYEVIDGRQRYETITRFMAGKMNLRKSALRKLSSVKELAGKGYNNLTVDYQDLFLDTKIRVIEFGFLSSEHSCEEEEQVKREIFQRYNSGITPLNQQQIDKAIYYSDDIVTCFKEHFAEDKRTYYTKDPNGIECDNDSKGTSLTPFTHPTISNLTIVGTADGKVAKSAMSDGKSMKSCANFRRNCQFTLANSILYGYPTGILCETSNSYVFKNNVVNGVSTNFSGITADATNTAAASVDAIGLTSPWGAYKSQTNLRPNAAPALSGADFGGLDSWFTVTSYKGAIPPTTGGANWMMQGTWVK